MPDERTRQSLGWLERPINNARDQSRAGKKQGHKRRNVPRNTSKTRLFFSTFERSEPV
jgi:hypothetical protein